MDRIGAICAVVFVGVLLYAAIDAFRGDGDDDGPAGDPRGEATVVVEAIAHGPDPHTSGY